MNTGDRIKSLRLSKSMTQKELSIKTNSSIVTVQCWENGSKKPSMDAIIALARTFDVSADYLLGIDSNEHFDSLLAMSKPEKDFIDKYRRLDAYGQKLVRTVCSMELTRTTSRTKTLFAETPIRYIPKYLTPSAAGMSVPLDGDDFEMIPVTDLIPAKADFAVKIQGDSMMPYIEDGDVIYVQRTNDINTGDIGVFAVNGAMYCKLFYRDGNGNIALVSTNPEFKSTNISLDINGNNSITCYGKVLLKEKISLPRYFVRD